MKRDGSIALFQYWNRLRNGRPAPRRTEIEPADIKSLLADTFILERDIRGEAVFRLAGTRLCSIYGRELKGFSFPSLWRAKDQRLIARLAYNVFESKVVVVINFDGVSRGGRSNPLELLLLPLDGGSDGPRALGVVSSEGRPFWLGIDPLTESLIDGVRVINPDREPMFLRNRPPMPVPPLAPDESSFTGQAAIASGGRRIRHLVVLDGGRDA